MYRWPYTASSGGSRRSRNISAGSSIARKSDKGFGGLTKEGLTLGIFVLQSNSAELLARDAHDDSVDESTFLERTLAKSSVDGEPTRPVGAESPLVRRQRPQFHHVKIHAVERVRQQRCHGVPAVAFAPRAGLTDVDVERADAIPASELIQSDLAHGPPLRLDDERVPLRARAFLLFGDVPLGEGLLVVHPPPDLGLVLPLMDEGGIPLRRPAGAARPAPGPRGPLPPGHAPRARPPVAIRPSSTSRYTDRIS